MASTASNVDRERIPPHWWSDKPRFRLGARWSQLMVRTDRVAFPFGDRFVVWRQHVSGGIPWFVSKWIPMRDLDADPKIPERTIDELAKCLDEDLKAAIVCQMVR